MKIRFFSLVIFSVFLASLAEEKHLVIVIPSYNNITWYERNLDSLARQTHTNWHALYIDDCSTDNTGQVVQNYIDQNNLSEKIMYTRNEHNHGALYNIYRAVHACAPSDIIILLDGDDWLKDEHALAHINALYQDPEVWLTYGKAQIYPDGGIIGWQSVPQEVVASNSFRSYQWMTTHMRTFYAWLFKKIRKEDLLYEGKFFSCAWDLALMFPMLEMAGMHSTLCPEVVYIYNMSNPISDYNVRLTQQLMFDKIIRARERYAPL